MGKFQTLYDKIVRNNQTVNIDFSDLQYFVKGLGFSEKNIKGDHFTYKMSGVMEKINLQPDGKDAKPYQVKQVRAIVLKYRLGGDDDGEI